MIKKFLCLLLALTLPVFGAEDLKVDTVSRRVINVGTVDFHTPGQLKVGGISVIGGSSGGGTLLSSLSLIVPSSLFVSPVNFDVSTGDVTGTLALATQGADTFYGNPTGSTAAPVFMSQGQARAALMVDNVDNTSDLNKPVSTATTAAINAFTGSVNITTLGTIATGTWVGSIIGNTYLPTLDSIRAPTASLSLNNQTIINLGDPVNPKDGTNKQYVDSVANAGPPHVAVGVASTANLTLSGEQTIDGVTTSASRILVKNQSTAANNGIYVTAAGAWSRASDANSGTTVSGNVFVTAGTVNSGTQWGLTTPQPITLGTTALSYTLTGAATIYAAGNGLTLSGSTFSAVGTSNRISVGGGGIDISSAYVGQATITTLGTIGTGTWNGSLVAGQYGGTGINNTGKTLTLSSSSTLGGTNTGDITLGAGQNYLSLSGQVLTANAVDLSGANATGVLAAGRFPALTGDVTTTAGSLATTIGNGKVFYGKIQNVAQSRLLGNPTGSNNSMSEIPLGAGLSFSGGALVATGTGNGTVTQLLPGTGFSPLFTTTVTNATTTPTLNFAAINAAPFSILGNPTNASAAPVFYLATDTQVGTDSDAFWTPGKTSFYEGAALTINRIRTLPPTANYGEGQYIDLSDAKTTLSVGPLVVPGGSDTLNGILATPWINAGYYAPYKAGGQDGHTKSVRFQKQGTNWQTVGDVTLAYQVVDPANYLRRFTFDASLQSPLTPGKVTAAFGDSVTLSPTDQSVPGVIKDINPDGSTIKNQVRPVELLPQADDIGVPGSIITDTTHLVADNGTKDTVRILGTLQTPYTVQWPSASNYSSSTDVKIIDFSGSVGPNRLVTIVSAKIPPDTFNGQSSITFDEANGRKIFTSDGINNWSVPTTKTTAQPFKVITPTSGNIFTITPDLNGAKAHLNLVNGQNIISIPNPSDGMTFDFVLIQPSSGAQGTITLPSISGVSANGIGVVSTTAANNSIDELRGSFDGTLNEFLWQPTIVNYTTAALPDPPTGLATGGITASKIDLTWTDASSNETGFDVQRAPGLSATTGFATLNPPISAPINATSYSDVSVAAGQPYTYRVRALGSAGNSAFSATANATASAGGATADIWEVHFDENGGLFSNSTIPNSGKALLNYAEWTAATQSSAAAFNPTAGMTPTSNLAITNQGNAATATYSYRVAAYRTSSGLHNSGQLVTTNTGNAVLDINNFNRITWNPVTGADYYIVYRTAVTGGSPTATGSLAGSGVAFTPSVACPGGVTCTFDDKAANVTVAGVPASISSTNDLHSATADSNLNYLGSGKITVSFWIKGTLVSPGTSLIVGAGLGSSGWRINYVNTGKIQITFPGATVGTLETATVPLSPINNGSWHNVVVQMDSTTAAHQAGLINVFLDGNTGTPLTVTYTAVSKNGALNFPNAAAQIADSTSTFAIDDVRIFSTWLNNTQIGNLFTGNAQ